MPVRDVRPTVIDLFSGVGGLSLGAARAGFRLAASVELDRIASRSHADNFPKAIHLEADVAKLSGVKLLESANILPGRLTGLVGGPPCQGFSLIGRRQTADPRNDLFGHFFRLVSETMPAFYVAENVPGILSDSTQNFVNRALGSLPKNYICLPPVRVQANLFGTATTRTRVFFIGYDPERVERLQPEDFLPPESIETVLVRDALRGLPGIRSSWQDESQSWRRVSEMPVTEFTQRLVDSIPRDVGNSMAIDRMRESREVSGFLGTMHTPETVRRFAKLRPGEVDSVYRSPRLKLNGFCPTLRAGTGNDRGSYQAVRPIHPRAPRVISPREAARLQGFPDWFLFHPTKWHSFRQIGNSVSPIVAERLFEKIRVK